ncbi:MAG TPA: HlyD family secretion protein [Pseudobdellovibrionaceae bacterium]|nr:HlyD family secretion protein [Pseudobdellovibrionaceae bacterium]
MKKYIYNRIKSRNIGISLILLCVFLGAGKYTYNILHFVTTDNAQVEAHSLIISSQVTGIVQKVNITEGQHVQKDEVLVVIDDRDHRAQVDHLRNELASLVARKLEAQRIFQRMSELFQSQVVSRQQYESAQANLQDFRARTEAAEAKLKQSELNLANTIIRAPTDGVIARKSAEIGQLLSAGSPVVGFVSSEGRWVVANFKETEVSDIAIGKHVDVEIDAIPRKVFSGRVEAISAATGSTFTLLPPDNATGNFTKVVQRVPVKIQLLGLSQNEIDRIQAGLSAEVKIHIN